MSSNLISTSLSSGTLKQGTILSREAEQALAAVEIAKEELIEWLEENIDKYIYITGEFARCKMFEDFRKALEE